MTSIQAVITELADVLELSPGSAKEPFTAPTFDLRRSNRLAALYNTHRKIMIRTKGIFHSRLSAQYLPSLIQLSLEVMNSSKFSASFNETAQLWIRGPSWLADAINYGCEQVSCFVRLHPEESSKIFKAFARWTDAASSLPEDAFVKLIKVIVTLTGALNGILSLQFANASSFRRGKVTFDALTITGVQTVISRLDQDPSYKLHFQYLRALLRSRFDLSVNTLELDLASTRTDIDNIRAKRGYWLYWSCEITGWKSESSSQGPCADLPQGIELSVCAGCGAVRYCSRAHQKADWKRHKPTCFKPTWMTD